MTRSEQITLLERQRDKLADKIRILEEKTNNYSEHYTHLRGLSVEQYNQLKQLQNFDDFCESVPETFLANVIDKGFLGFNGSLAISLICGRLWSPFIAAIIIGGIGSVIKTSITYYSLKKKAVIGDLMNFEMLQYDVDERMKGIESAQSFMRSASEMYKYEALDINDQISGLVKEKIR